MVAAGGIEKRVLIVVAGPTPTPTPDIIPPTIISVLPADGATDVAVTTTISATFSEAMNKASAEMAFSVDGVAGTFSWAGNTMTFTPSANLEHSKIYTVTIAATATDLAGNGLDGNGNGTADGTPIDDYSWAFTTTSLPPPYGVTISQPANRTTYENENATYLLTVTNIGSTADAYTLSVQNIDGATTAALNQTVMTLSGGASDVVALNVTNTAAGTFNVTVTATSPNADYTTGYIMTAVVAVTPTPTPIPPEPITVTRTSVEGTVAGTAVVTVNYTVNTAITALAIKEIIPSDWTITTQTSSPAATIYKDSTHEWLYMTPPGVGESGTITYTVSGPAGDSDTISGGYNIGAGYVDTPSTVVRLSGIPIITSFAPPSPVNATVCNWTAFNVTVNQTVNVSWYLNESLLFTNESVTEADYTLHAEVPDEHNVSAVATNANGTDMQTWIWNVTEAPPAPTATRTLPSSVAPGGTFEVGIVATNYGVAGQVVETLPAGFDYVNSSLSPSAVTQEGQTVKFSILAEDWSFTYNVTASSTPGTYTFSGILKDFDKNEYEVGGDSAITVNDAVTRTLPATATAGSTINVSLNVTVECATYYAIDEQVPAGWTVTSATGGGDFTSDPGHVKWVIISGATDTTYTYTVSIPATAAGPYTFTGIYMLEGMTEEANIGGDSSIKVGVNNTITIEDVILYTNTTKEIPINLLNSTGVGGVQVTLSFDPSVVNVTNITEGDFNDFFNPDYSNVTDGVVRITCMKSGEDLTGDLTIANICLEAVTDNGSCVLGLNAELTDKAGNFVPSTIKNGTVTVIPKHPGDVNDDGKVNIQDAVLLFNWVSFPNEQGTTYLLAESLNADVNADAKINIQDAVLLFNWVSFPNERGTTYILR